MKSHFAFLAASILAIAPRANASITIDSVVVGNPGNPNDTALAEDGAGIFGAVNYTYSIGKFDVTQSQYVAFLNAVAKTDTYGLYDPDMSAVGHVGNTNPHQNTGAGIARSGAPGGYNYSVIGTSGNLPVTYVSWYNAARFVNWLNNGQPSGLQGAGTTETGAYTLTGNTGLPKRNPNAFYYVPSESEWYKAAFYDPNKGGPAVGGYWLYPTASNSVPSNTISAAPNHANYYNGLNNAGDTFVGGVFTVTQSGVVDPTQNYMTDVGTFSGSASPYGTFDQGGDAYNWKDTPDGFDPSVSGGSAGALESGMRSTAHGYEAPDFESGDLSFRIVIVPEPSAAAIGSMLIIARRPGKWRRRYKIGA